MRKRQCEVSLRTLGGIADIALLRQSIEWAVGSGQTNISAGPYQDLRLMVHARALDVLPGHLAKQVSTNLTMPNIMSSAASLGLTASTVWLTEGYYREVADSLVNVAQVPVGLCDAAQKLVPHRCGELNFIASEVPSHWRCFVNSKQFDCFDTERAIPSDYIAPIVQHYQEFFRGKPQDVTGLIDDVCAGASLPEQRRLVGLWDLATPLLGLSLGSNDRQGSLCIDAIQPIDAHAFLEILIFAQSRGIATAHITSWRSVLLKGIRSDDVHEWRRLLGRLGIPQYAEPLNGVCILGENSDAQHVMDALRRSMRSGNLAAPCLPFAICPDAGQGEAPVSIYAAAKKSRFSPKQYDLVVDTIAARPLGLVSGVWRGLSLARVVNSCCEIIRQYNSTRKTVRENQTVRSEVCGIGDAHCECCGTLYSPEIGDLMAGIAPGVDFESLPGDWICPVCEAPKGSYACASMAAE